MELPSPDPYTNEWYIDQFLRLNNLTQHLHTAFLSELTSNTHQLNSLRKELNELSRARQQDAIKIGELMDLLDQQRVRLDKASEFVKGLRKEKEVACPS